mmetsp:Transcript_13075/g.26132  ORF Transcript_13075/g.26132 Transcript_13075/m.26132 type:complete len:261 (+) Transcript_13075:1193-1975(+)
MARSTCRPGHHGGRPRHQLHLIPLLPANVQQSPTRSPGRGDGGGTVRGGVPARDSGGAFVAVEDGRRAGRRRSVAAAVLVANRHGGDHGAVLGHGDAVAVVGFGVDGSKSQRNGGVAVEVAVAFLSGVCLSNVATAAAPSRLREIVRTAVLALAQTGGHARLPPPSTRRRRRIIGHGRVEVLGAHSAAEGADDSVDEAAASRGGSSGGEGAEHDRDGWDREGSLELCVLLVVAGRGGADDGGDCDVVVIAIVCESEKYFA